MENTNTLRIEAHQINFNLINSTIEKIKEFVKANDYQFKHTTGFEEIIESNFNRSFNDLSQKKRKKLTKSIWKVTNHPTLKTVNLFFHFLMKDVMKTDSRIRVIKSAKELAIEEKRKTYKEALAKMRAAYVDYKQEKSDFFKIK